MQRAVDAVATQCQPRAHASNLANVKSCGHSDCALSLTACCGCSDLRSLQNTLYQVYLDGVGMTEGHRWSFYCAACKDRFCEDESVVDRITAPSEEIDNDESRLSRRRARVLANYQRVFGTRDEIEETEYESPLSIASQSPIF